MISFSSEPLVAEQQMHAIIFYLTSFGYVDGDFDRSEKDYIRDYIAKLVQERARQALGGNAASSEHRDVVSRWTAHFHEVLDQIDQGIQADFDETVAQDEKVGDYVIARLKLRCFELFKKFDEDNRRQLLGAADELIMADGVVHPNERRFREELAALLSAPMELDMEDLEPVKDGEVIVDASKNLPPRHENHPFFARTEFDYVRSPDVFVKQASQDMELVRKALAKLEEQRAVGKGRLGDAVNVSEFRGQAPFLDGHVYVVPAPEKDVELLVLGDLHGCYSCLKAALLQANFFEKVQAFHDDPEHNPDMKLVLLGDYIDRGRFSYNGVLRTVLNLFLTVPEHVYVLRGNHEYYVELNGRVYGGVRPADAIDDLKDIAPTEVFKTYRELFESLPNMLMFDRTLFVHAGIPRDETIAAKWLGMSSLNDSEIRFEMLWSDPSDADFIPRDLQKATARFPFGRLQFKRFMSSLGCTTMIRGHERILEGFKKVYDDGEYRLFDLFSAGGADNLDLPPSSSYRKVIPHALTMKYQAGVMQISPFPIACSAYNDPEHNAFFRVNA